MYLTMTRAIALVSLALASLAAKAEPIPIEAWSHDPYIEQVQLSPSGKRMLAITLTGVNQPPEVSVWDTTDLSKAPVRMKPKRSKVIGAYWLSDDKLLIIGRQKFDIRAGGKPTRTFRSPVYAANADGSGKIKELFRTRNNIRGANVVNMLRDQPNKVLMELFMIDGTTEFVELNTKTMIGKKIFRGGDSSSYNTDSLGQVKIRQQLKTDSKGIHFTTALRTGDSKKWVEHFKFYAQDRAGIEVQTIAADGTVYVLDSQNFDKAAIRTYDPVTKTLGEPLYSDPEFEMGGVVTDRYNQKGKNDVIGYVLSGPDRTIIYTDPAWQDLIKRVNAALPQRDNSISSITRDKTLAVIYSSSTTHAGSYYLLVNGRQLLPLGERYPHLKEEQLAGMKFVYYKARDGLKIPAFLATPKTGKAPYPTIILPHGGPWARDYLSFDPWVQFLADRGYAVLQPQYRGSQGWGQKLWRAGDKEWGQKMQDDKDDGAAWLVEQGIADKDRIAMFGYSYGGYAAMAAVVRPNSPYQCAIAGAGLSELDSFDKVTFTNPFNRNFQNPTIDGLSPLYNIKDANIPLLLFHGDRDIRVPVDQSRKYYKALKKAGHDVQYVEIPDLWHSNPWFPQHKAVMYTELERYLANDCGPGGL